MVSIDSCIFSLKFYVFIVFMIQHGNNVIQYFPFATYTHRSIPRLIRLGFNAIHFFYCAIVLFWYFYFWYWFLKLFLNFLIWVNIVGGLWHSLWTWQSLYLKYSETWVITWILVKRRQRSQNTFTYHSARTSTIAYLPFL